MPTPSTPKVLSNVPGYAADVVEIPDMTPTGQGIPSIRDLFPFITQVDPDAGGVMVQRDWMNALFNLLGQHAFFQQSGCVYPWEASLGYLAGCHVMGSDGAEYIALQASGPDVPGVGPKDPAAEASRAYWISLAAFVQGGLVPDTRRVIAGTGLTGGGALSADVTLALATNIIDLINGAVQRTQKVNAGTGMTGGGPLSGDVTLSAKLTDSVSSTDSTTAASATAVKAAYDAAESKLSLSGGTVTGSLSIRNILDLIGTAPATEQELGLYLLDKNSNIMGGHDFVHSVGNLKITQMYARNSSGLLSSLGVYASEDGTRYTLSSHNIILTSDVEIGRMHADGVRLITFSGAGGSPGLMMRYSPDSGELYLDGRAVHGKADTAGYADTAGSANTLGGKAESALSVNYANSAGSAGNAGTLGGKAESALSVAYARDSGAMNGKAESALSVAFASEAQNAYALQGMDMIIVKTTHTLPNYGTWKYMYLVATDEKWIDMVIGESPGGTTLTPNYPGYPDAFMDGMAFRSA